MHILDPSSPSIQFIYFIPRSDIASSVDVSFYDKQERTTTVKTLSVSSQSIGGKSTGFKFVVFNDVPDIMEEGRFYSMTMKNQGTDDIVYKGMVFSTEQTDYNRFDVHKDDYVVEDSYDNEYVIL